MHTIPQVKQMHVCLFSRIQSMMEYKNENAGIELLLAHMNIEDFIQEAEKFYCVEEVESSASFEESFSQDDIDEEAPGMAVSRDLGKVNYGTASELLDFVNTVSNMPSSLLDVGEEMGVLLNKVQTRDSQFSVMVAVPVQ